MSSRSPEEQEAGQRYRSEKSDRLTIPREKEPSRRTLVAASRDIAIVVFALGYFPRRFHKCDRLFRLSGAWVSGETLILHEQGTAPPDDHAERQDEEETGGLLRGDEFAYVTAQRQADGRQHEDDHDEPW